MAAPQPAYRCPQGTSDPSSSPAPSVRGARAASPRRRAGAAHRVPRRPHRPRAGARLIGPWRDRVAHRGLEVAARRAFTGRCRPPTTSTTSPRTRRDANSAAAAARVPRHTSSCSFVSSRTTAAGRSRVDRRELFEGRDDPSRRLEQDGRALVRHQRRHAAAAVAALAGQEAFDAEPVRRQPAHDEGADDRGGAGDRAHGFPERGQLRHQVGAGVRDAGGPGVTDHGHGGTARHQRGDPPDAVRLVVPVQREEAVARPRPRRRRAGPSCAACPRNRSGRPPPARRGRAARGRRGSRSASPPARAAHGSGGIAQEPLPPRPGRRPTARARPPGPRGPRGGRRRGRPNARATPPPSRPGCACRAPQTATLHGRAGHPHHRQVDREEGHVDGEPGAGRVHRPRARDVQTTVPPASAPQGVTPLGRRVGHVQCAHDVPVPQEPTGAHRRRGYRTGARRTDARRPTV